MRQEFAGEPRVRIMIFIFVAIGILFECQNIVYAETANPSGRALADGDVKVEFQSKPERITAGVPVSMAFSIRNQEGKPVEDLTLHHERILHVVIVGRDLKEFAHIHPEDLATITPRMKKTGRFLLRFTFPKAGRYIIGVDFSIKEQPFSRQFLVDVSGEPKMGLQEKDLTTGKRVGDLDVTITTVPERITAGKEVVIRYLFRENRGEVTDLEPYLSAPMHLAIVSGDLSYFMHTHGELPGVSAAMEHHEHHMQMAVPEKFGPEIDVHAVFPSRGTYAIFGQTKHRGKVILTSFMIEVE